MNARTCLPDYPIVFVTKTGHKERLGVFQMRVQGEMGKGYTEGHCISKWLVSRNKQINSLLYIHDNEPQSMAEMSESLY